MLDAFFVDEEMFAEESLELVPAELGGFGR